MRLLSLLINVLYRLFCLFPQRRKVAFLSRQSARPFDFVLLESALRKALPDYGFVWACVPKTGKMTPAVMMRQLWHAATACVCFVDGYVPAVSIPRDRHRAYCIQLWHAAGAIKKFGRQCLDTREGRSSREADILAMHCGYDRIVAGFSGAIPAFAAALGYAEDAIAPLGLPRMDFLVDDAFAGERERLAAPVRKRLLGAGCLAPGHKLVLYAPTFRRHPANERWLEDSVCALRHALPPSCDLVVSGHPLQDVLDCHVQEQGRIVFLAGSPTIHALGFADYVVSDYSAVTLEAGLLGKKVLLYTPDIEAYRESPGLNVDPERELATITFRAAEDVACCIAADIDGSAAYDMRGFRSFMDGYGMPWRGDLHAIEDIVRLTTGALESQGR